MLVNKIAINNTYSLKKYKNNEVPQDNCLATTSTANNGITFAQADAIKNSLLINKVSFMSRPSYDPEDIKIIQKILEKCRYGKRELISGKSVAPIKIKTESGLALENFYTNDDRPDGLITGICEELTYKIGRRLETLFGDKYIYFGIQGSKGEFAAHTHLGILQNTPENQGFLTNAQSLFSDIRKGFIEFTNSPNYKFMEGQVNLAGNDTEKINRIYNSTQGVKLRQDHDLLKNEAERQRAVFTTNNLKNSLMVDPSYKHIDVFGYKNDNKRPTTYMGKTTNEFDDIVVKDIFTLNQINAVPSKPRFIGDHSEAVPIGRLGYLFPNDKISPTEKDKALCLFSFGDLILPLPLTKEWKYGLLKNDHPLVQFIDRLNK